MITALRSRLGTWFARVLFGVLVAAFSIWGIGDVIRQLGTETWVAKVGNRAIEPPELQQAYQQELSRITRMLGGQIDATLEMKRGILSQALDQLVRQHAVGEEVARLNLVAPDSALGQDILAIPAFRSQDGKFSRAAFQAVLRNNGLTEARFMDSLRVENLHRQLLEPIRASIVPSDTLTRQVYQFATEQRDAELVELPFAAIPASEPSAAKVRRWYDNHPDFYTRPEYRRIKAVILAPQTLESQITIAPEDIATSYEARRAEFTSIEKRSAEIIIAQEEAKVATLAQQWRAGASWEAMQKASTDADAAPVSLTDATAIEFPDPALAQAVFAAAANTVIGPIQTPLGWQLIRVGKITPGGTKTLSDVTEELRARILAEKVADIIYQRATKVEDTLAAGTSLDDMPGDLGLAAVTGTLDALGTTLAGDPASIPGSAELRTALITASFQVRQGDPAKLIEVPAGKGGNPAYFAVTVEEVIPPGLKPFSEVLTRIKDDLILALQRRAQEEVAARLLDAVQQGQSLEDAATVAGIAYRRTARTGRAEPAEGIPRELIVPLFALSKGEATMVETSDAFLVTVPLDIVQADPKTDEAGYARIRDSLAQAMANDAETVFVNTLRSRAQPRINQKVYDSFVQP